jgi:FimV-like protein
MNEQEIINFKLDLARAWIQNGHEDLARELVKSIIVKAEGQNE